MSSNFLTILKLPFVNVHGKGILWLDHLTQTDDKFPNRMVTHSDIFWQVQSPQWI